MAILKDSGERTEYETGAVRDCKDGNGRCDLMPLDVVADLLSGENDDDWEVIRPLSHFQETGEISSVYLSLWVFANEQYNGSKFTMLLEVAKHFEDGANKYGPNNWQKGIPIHSYIDSAIRHYLKYRAGWTDEPHDRAFVWNLMCCIWTMKHHPELDDFTKTLPI